MSKKDEVLIQLESVLKELRMGKEESAATAVVGQSKGNPNILAALFKLIFKY